MARKPDHITRCTPIRGAVAVKFGATGSLLIVLVVVVVLVSAGEESDRR